MSYIIQSETPISEYNPIWTKNEFVGAPPEEYNSWSEWVESSTVKGFFTGVRIEAINTK